MNQLLPCPHCNRHHRVCEPVCPFCGGELPPCKAAPRASARGRLNRATLFAAGAALLGGASCDDNRSGNAHYGLPGIMMNPDGGKDTAAPQDAVEDVPMNVSIDAAYGAPATFPTPDAPVDQQDAAVDTTDADAGETE